MCLIIVSEDGKLPKASLVETANKKNPDGWGIMYPRKSRVHVIKGMSKETERLDHALQKAKGRPFVLHFRWATDGSICQRNCHPFKVHDGLWMAHNGRIFGVKMDRLKDRTDSWFFAQELADTVQAYPDWANSDEFVPWVEAWIGKWNKIAFLRADGKIQIANRSEGREYEGLWLSNSLSIPEHQYQYQQSAGYWVNGEFIPWARGRLQRGHYPWKQKGKGSPKKQFGFNPSPYADVIYAGQTNRAADSEATLRGQDGRESVEDARDEYRRAMESLRAIDESVERASDDEAIDAFAAHSLAAEAVAQADGVDVLEAGAAGTLPCEFCSAEEEKLFLHEGVYLCSYCKRTEMLYAQSRRRAEPISNLVRFNRIN